MSSKIIRNAVRCHKCGDVIESNHVHDFKWCSCGNVAVDGGYDYLKRCFKEYGTWDDLSESVECDNEEEVATIEITDKDRDNFIKSLSDEERELFDSVNKAIEKANKKKYESSIRLYEGRW